MLGVKIGRASNNLHFWTSVVNEGKGYFQTRHVFNNRPYIGLEVACNDGYCGDIVSMQVLFNIRIRICLHFKLVRVQY